MAQNNDVLIPKTAIDGITKANTEIVKLDESTYKFIATVEKLSKELKDNSITLEQVQKAQKKTGENSKTAAQLAEQEAKAKEKQRLATEKAGKAVLKAANQESLYFKELKKSNKEKEAAAKITAKQAAKEKELVDALKLEVKTEEDAIRQNKALRAVKRQVIQTDEEGIKKIEELNNKINQNTDFLKNSADTYVSTKMNVGNYKNEIVDAASELQIFGVSVNQVSDMMKSGAGIVAAIGAVIIGLGKAYASSARGAEDLARANDRLTSITSSLGNALADASGEGNLFDDMLRFAQTSVFGLASTIKSDLQVAILSSIRQLEILNLEQESQKKDQLNRAEVFRQIRDEESNSFEERVEANKELGKVIREREQATIKFQEEKIAKYKTLLKFDEGNIEIQQAIKQLEFEIADAREEAQGFRSEQLVNAMALSKEYYANELELSNLNIQNEILRNGETLELRKKLIDNTLDLELKAAGNNEQLRKIAIQKANNDRLAAEQEVVEAAKTAAEQYKTTWATAVKELRTELKAQAGSEAGEFLTILDAELDAELAKIDEEVDAYTAGEEAKTDATEKEAAKRQAINEKLKEVGIAAINGAFDIYQNSLDRRSQANEIQKAHEIQLANGNAEEEERINAKYEAKEIELNKKKDKSERTQALFNIALSTAQAIASASPVVPLMILAAAFGAIQLAVVASTPLPQYWTGIDSVPTDSAVMVGDRGRELIEKDGKFSIANQPTITSGLKGAKVYNNKETEMMLNGRSGGSSIDISELSSKQDETNDLLRKMGKLPIHKKGTYDIFRDQIKYPV